MVKLGKWAILTHDEVQAIADEARARGYHAGLQSKWRAKKLQEPMSALDVARESSAFPAMPITYGDSLPLPNRNAETYDEGHEEESQFNMKEAEAEDAA